MSSPAARTVAVVGAGRVGQALGRLLAQSGYSVTEVVSRRAAAARAAARFIGAGRPSSIRALGRLDAGLVLIATPDDEIAAAAARLAALPRSFEGAVVLHTSGARGADELGALRARGAAVGSLHPLQTFPTPELALRLVAGSIFALEGDRRAVAAGRHLARALGGRPVRLRAGSKALYHAAAVLASGGVTGLLDMSLGALERAGLDRATALDAILPLVEGTVANIKRVDTAAALTGPVARGDRGTIERNRAALAALGPEVAAVYDLLARRGEQLRGRRHGARER